MALPVTIHARPTSSPTYHAHRIQRPPPRIARDDKPASQPRRKGSGTMAPKKNRDAARSGPMAYGSGSVYKTPAETRDVHAAAETKARASFVHRALALQAGDRL